MANDIKKNDYGKNEQISHRGDKAEKNSVAYWQKHPLSLSERLKQFKNLREQRFAREAKLLRSEPLQ